MSKKTTKILFYIGLYIVTTLLVMSVFFWGSNEHDDFPILRTFIILFASVLLVKYFLYMLVSPWYDVLIRKKKIDFKHKEYTPLVSVIIPAWNEEVGLVGTVKTILQSTYRNVEIIVINDGSTDMSDYIMNAFLDDYDAQHEPHKIPILYKYKKNEGKGRALNEGISLASGEIILSIDADCVVPPQTIGNFVEHFKDEKVMAAVGNVKIGN